MRYKDRLLQAEQEFRETMTLPATTIKELLRICNLLDEPSTLDDYLKCLDVVEDDKWGRAGNFEHLLIATIRSADQVHRNRLAAGFPELCMAMDALRSSRASAPERSEAPPQKGTR